MNKTYKYDCLTYNQRNQKKGGLSFCLFHAPAGEVLEWADIERLETGPGGAQRSLNSTKVRSVERFLDDKVNTIPTAVIIALDVSKRSLTQKEGENLKIHIKTSNTSPKRGVIIDGQHRLLGMMKFDPNMHVNIVALLTDNENEIAFQFLVINNKSSKVATDHIKAILAEKKDEDFKDRLRRARLSISPRYGFVEIANSDGESPFNNLVDWPTNRNGEKWIKPAAIESALKDIQDRKVPEFEDDDNLVEFFFTIWRVIKSEWSDLWTEKSKLLSKVGIVCMTQYITNSIVNSYDLSELDVTNLKDVDSRVRLLLKMQKSEFWTTEWTSSSYDTQSGRKIVVDSLVQVSRNIRQKIAWMSDVEILGGE